MTQQACQGAQIPVAFTGSLNRGQMQYDFGSFYYRYYLSDPDAYDLRLTDRAELVGGERLPEWFLAAAAEPGDCPVLLWSVSSFSREQILEIERRLQADSPGLAITIIEFPHSSLWPWTGTWLWARRPPDGTKTFIVLVDRN